MEKAGKVYLVGAGPGDPDLLTLKGLKLIQSCDVLIYDRLVSDRLLDYVKEGCELVYVGKTVGSHRFHQEEINQIIIEKALKYPFVVRLKGGDPFVFGRGGEEILALKDQGIPYEVVPGVTSAIAAAAYAGIPVTHRGSSQSFTVVTGHTAEEDCELSEDLKALARSKGTLIILMGIGHMDKIRDALLEGGKAPETPAAVVSNGTTPYQKEVRGTLKDICEKVKEEGITAPAIIIIGDVAELTMKSTISYPLSGVKIGITGTQKIREKLINQFEELGAQVTSVSSLEVVEVEDQSAFDKTLLSLQVYQWIVFTSTNAVEIFFRSLERCTIDHRKLSHLRFAVIGDGTREALLQYGYQADLMPHRYTTSELAYELCKQVNTGEKLLIPRARQGSEELIEILSNHQIQFEEYKIYDVRSRGIHQDLLDGKLMHFNYLTFASSSGVHGFFQELPIEPRSISKQTKVVCIGEATEKALKEYGFTDILIAEEASVIGIVECIRKDIHPY